MSSPPEVTRTQRDEPPTEEPVRLMIFGGQGRDVYLGCLSCDPRKQDSIFNELGAYGSAESPFSIYNRACAYGSERSPLSPLNPHATRPPVIRDQYGHIYGYLTVNGHMPQAFRDVHVEAWLRKVQ